VFTFEEADSSSALIPELTLEPISVGGQAERAHGGAFGRDCEREADRKVRWNRQDAKSAKQPCFLSRVEGRNPCSLIPEDRVQDGEQLAHAGDQGDLTGLARREETLVKCSDDGVVRDGGNCRHVEGHACRRSSSSDVARQTPLAAVDVVRRETSESRDLLAVELSELG
jgi:hypothetical protein